MRASKKQINVASLFGHDRKKNGQKLIERLDALAADCPLLACAAPVRLGRV